MTKFQTDDGRVHIAEPAHVNGSPPGLTQALATAWAEASDLISVNPPQFQGFDQLISQLCVTMQYTKAFGDTDATQPEANYSHHWTGAALVRKANAQYHPQVNIMQPGSGWDVHERDRLVALKAKYPYNHAFFNDSARAAYDIGGPPVVPGTHTADTRASWNAKGKASLDMRNAAVGYKYACLNGLNMADTMTQFTPCIGMIESAYGALDHTLPSLAEWKHLADLIWQSQGLGWTPWVYVKMNTTPGSAEWDAFRALTLPTALLLDRGSLLYCIGGKEGTPPAWATGEYAHPWYRPGIGIPTRVAANYSDYLQPSGAYVKPYTQGAVVVNPTPAAVVATLDAATTVQVDAQSGKIMRHAQVMTTTWAVV